MEQLTSYTKVTNRELCLHLWDSKRISAEQHQRRRRRRRRTKQTAFTSCRGKAPVAFLFILYYVILFYVSDLIWWCVTCTTILFFFFFGLNVYPNSNTNAKFRWASCWPNRTASHFLRLLPPLTPLWVKLGWARSIFMGSIYLSTLFFSWASVSTTSHVYLFTKNIKNESINK